MSFRKPYHMPFLKLVPPFTLTGFYVNDGFAVRALIAQARLFENVFKLKTRQVYFIYLFPCRMKLGKALKTCRVTFFLLN